MTEVEPGVSIKGKASFGSPTIGALQGRRHALCVGGQSHSRTNAMPEEPILREKARDAIRGGRLPAAKPSRTITGPSAGATCALCGDPVLPGEIEFELEFRAGPPPEDKSFRDTLERLRARPEVRRCHLHLPCFAAWELERVKIGGQPDKRPL